MAKDKRLSGPVQSSLGRSLREFYRPLVEHLPLHLVGLAHRVDDAKDAGRSVLPTPFDELKGTGEEAFDPATVRILVDAFDRAWTDLQGLKKNPATEDMLARTLMALVKGGERNPSKLATAAVLQLVAPRRGSPPANP